mgnify:CR=1 FL=1
MAEKVKTKCPLCGDVLSAGGYEAEFSADIGATCFRLFYKPLNAEILRTPNGESQRNTNVYLFGNPILFPPNRIRGGRFVFRGKEYVLPVNEPQTGCFIHGNLLNLPFAKKQISQSEIEFTYSAKKGEYLGFPHDFTVRRHYKLGENGLEEYTTVINDGVCEMPVMLAYHTTFNLDFYGDMQNVKLQVPVTQEYLRDKNFLPTGETAYGRPRDLALANGEFVPAKQPFSAFYKANDKTVALFKGKAIKAVKKELQGKRKRKEELSRLMQVAYEDRVKGKMPEDICIGFIQKYSEEQKRLETEIAESETRLTETANTIQSADDFIRNIKKYLEVPELTREMCYELIDRIIIGGHPKHTGKEREIDIVYKIDIASVLRDKLNK